MTTQTSIPYVWDRAEDTASSEKFSKRISDLSAQIEDLDTAFTAAVNDEVNHNIALALKDYMDGALVTVDEIDGKMSVIVYLSSYGVDMCWDYPLDEMVLKSLALDDSMKDFFAAEIARIGGDVLKVKSDG